MMPRLRLASALLLFSGMLAGSTLERLTLDEMIGKSTDIVRGRILDTRVMERGPVLYTVYRIQVAERWKGKDAGSLEVAVPGGNTAVLRQNFSGAPKMVRGAEYVLFLWKGTSGIVHVIGLSQGVFDLKADSAGLLRAVRGPIQEKMLNAAGQSVTDAGIDMQLTDLRQRVESTLSRGARR